MFIDELLGEFLVGQVASDRCRVGVSVSMEESGQCRLFCSGASGYAFGRFIGVESD